MHRDLHLETGSTDCLSDVFKSANRVIQNCGNQFNVRMECFKPDIELSQAYINQYWRLFQYK